MMLPYKDTLQAISPLYGEKKTKVFAKMISYAQVDTGKNPTFQFLLKCDFQRPFSD